MKTLPNRKLSTHLLVSILTAHIIISAIIISILLQVLSDGYKNQFIDQARTTSRLLSNQIKYLSYGDDLKKIKDFIDEQVFSSVVIYAGIKIKNTFISEYADLALENFKPEKFKEDFYFAGNGDAIYYISLPSFDHELNQISTLYLGFDETLVNEELSTLYRNTILFTLLYLLITTVILLVVSSIITKPLILLKDSAAKIAKNPSRKITQTSNIKEIQSLSNTLEFMRTKILEKQNESEQHAEYLQLIMQQMAEAVIIFDKSGNVETSNRSAQILFEYSDTGMSELNFGSLFNISKNKFKILVFKGEKELTFITKSNKTLLLKSKISTMSFIGDHKYIVNFNDITESKRYEQELHKSANYDILTGLPNRLLFMDRALSAMKRTIRQDKLIAIFFLDIDHFKKVNDTFGHTQGDLLLQQIAVRISKAIRASDTLARLGGDEFTLLLENITHVNNIHAISQNILDGFKKPFLIDGNDVVITASIGISIYPFQDENLEQLLIHADTAMYSAKAKGRNNYKFYSYEMRSINLKQITLEAHLSHALEKNEFILHFQPQVDAKTKVITGFEALIRWNKDLKSLVPPNDFIPLLEQNGLIKQVGDWIILEACKQFRSWLDLGAKLSTISVNISAIQLDGHHLFDTILLALKKYDLKPEQLEVEVTESVVMYDEINAINILTELHEYGVKIAIDDFGTGYSSLSYLRKFPIDTLKIDKSFIDELELNEDDRTISNAIIVMAQALKLVVVAEGVETQAQLDILREQKCDLIQGYFISRPIPTEEVPKLLKLTH